MVIDVKKLKISGKYQTDFAFEFTPEENLLLLPDAYIDGSVNVIGTLELHEDDCYVDGTINCKIVGKCARCVEVAEHNFNIEFSVKYVRANPDLEEFEYIYKSGVVDLRQAVSEIISLNQPQIIYCKEECKGLCPICGSNLNEKDCNCKY